MRHPILQCLFLMLGLALSAYAFTPPECTEEHASNDAKEAKVVALGRIVGLREERAPDGSVSIVATFRIEHSYKGTVERGTAIEFINGIASPADDGTPRYSGIGGTMPLLVEMDGVYVLFLIGDPAAEARFRPRSYHFSVHPVVERVDEATERRWSAVMERVTLSDFREHPSVADFLTARGL